MEKHQGKIAGAVAMMMITASSVFGALIDNLVLYAPLNETSGTTVDNLAPGSTDGARLGSGLINQTGVIGSSYKLGAYTNDHAKVSFNAFAANALASSDKITISVWANPTWFSGSGLAGGRSIIFSTDGDLQFGFNGLGQFYCFYNAVLNGTAASAGPLYRQTTSRHP
jgi:hypothetical protein